MKLNKQILNEIIKKELNSLLENDNKMESDVAKIKQYLETYRINDLINDKINNKKEFLQLINVMIELSPLKDEEELIALRTAVQGVMKAKAQTQQGTE